MCRTTPPQECRNAAQLKKMGGSGVEARNINIKIKNPKEQQTRATHRQYPVLWKTQLGSSKVGNKINIKKGAKKKPR
jgi:hypothetical protein